MAKIADKVNEKIGKLDDRKITGFYGVFILLANLILMIRVIHHIAINIFYYVPLYIKIVIALLSMLFLVGILNDINKRLGIIAMDEKDLKNIFSLFTELALYILFFGSMYYEAIKIKETTKINNLQLLIINAFYHIPPYIFITIMILLIPIFIDMWNEMVKRSKMDKKQTEKRVEYLKLSSGEEIPVITLDIDHFCGTREANIGFLIICIISALGIPGILILILNYPHITLKQIIISSTMLIIMALGIIYIFYKN